MNLVARKALMASLLAAFVVQSTLVYADPTADALGPLSDEALHGRRIWHEHNCQACHQIYGFGGFLGPDLTNAAQRLSRARLDEVLTAGNAQMPAFHLSPDEITAIETYFAELDQTGIGVARAAAVNAQEIFAALDAHVAESPPPEPVRRGLATFRTTCTVCHVPLQPTALGLQTAPDLTTVAQRLAAAAIRGTIVQGRPTRGMPAWPLPEATVDDLVAMLAWFAEQRQALARRVPALAAAQRLPCWEFQ
jgi:nitric oxide reductase subunit C